MTSAQTEHQTRTIFNMQPRQAVIDPVVMITSSLPFSSSSLASAADDDVGILSRLSTSSPIGRIVSVIFSQLVDLLGSASRSAQSHRLDRIDSKATLKRCVFVVRPVLCALSLARSLRSTLSRRPCLLLLSSPLESLPSSAPGRPIESSDPLSSSSSPLPSAVTKLSSNLTSPPLSLARLSARCLACPIVASSSRFFAAVLGAVADFKPLSIVFDLGRSDHGATEHQWTACVGRRDGGPSQRRCCCCVDVGSQGFACCFFVPPT